MLARVNNLGTATERMFSRLYTSFNRRSKLQSEIEKTRALQRRNRQLTHFARQSEAEIERLNGILASIDEGIIMQDTDGRVVLINAAARKLLGSQRNFWESELGSLFDTYRDITMLDSELAPLGEPTLSDQQPHSGRTGGRCRGQGQPASGHHDRPARYDSRCAV